MIEQIAKSPSVDFLLDGRRKLRFSPSLQINDLLRKPLICAAIRGRDADFLRSRHDRADRKKSVRGLFA